jgi:hypothetical protein
MKSRMPKEIIRKNIQIIIDSIKNAANLLVAANRELPLQFVRVTEKFDVVERSQFKGWVLRPNGK